MMIKSAVKYEKHLKYLLMAYLVIQPFLEILLNLWPELLSVGGISVATMIRYALLGVLVAGTLALSFQRRSTKLFFVYLIAVAVYVILQWINVKGFGMVVMEVPLNKGLVPTALFVSRYAIPVIMVYEVYALRFTKADLKLTVMLVGLFVSVSMIVANLTGTDNVSYSFDETTRPAGTMLEWFGSRYEEGWKLYTSRGWFRSGNQVSGLMALLLPLTLWIALKGKELWQYIVLGLHLMALLMLATRVSTYAALLLGVATVVIWLLNLLLKKEKPAVRSWISLAVVAVLFAVVFVQSPFYCRAQSGEAGFDTLKGYEPPAVTEPNPSQGEDSKEDEESKPSQEGNSAESEEQRAWRAYQFARKNWIPLDVVSEQYRYHEHRDFWDHMVQEVELAQRDTARDVKELILKDIVDTKGDALDALVGIGEVPIYPERDYVSQYYYLGIIGLLLFVLPFVAILCLAAVLAIKRLFGKRSLGLLAVLLLSGGFLYAVAAFSGHVLEPLLVNTYLGLLCGMMCRLCVCENEEKEEIKEQIHA